MAADGGEKPCVSQPFIRSRKSLTAFFLQYVSKILVDAVYITLIDVMGEERQLDGTIKMVDLANSKVIINCAE